MMWEHTFSDEGRRWVVYGVGLSYYNVTGIYDIGDVASIEMRTKYLVSDVCVAARAPHFRLRFGPRLGYTLGVKSRLLPGKISESRWEQLIANISENSGKDMSGGKWAKADRSNLNSLSAGFFMEAGYYGFGLEFCMMFVHPNKGLKYMPFSLTLAIDI